jgi:hypothetical protein
MHLQFSILFCICIALTIPLLALSTSTQEIQEELIGNAKNRLSRFQGSNQQPFHSFIDSDESNDDDDHLIYKKAANFEQILKPCNRMPASGRGQEYADCVRSRMLLMGRRKRR